MLHPSFTSPLAWATRLDDALDEARVSTKAVFVVHGGARCVGTRGFVEKTLAKDEVVELVGERFIALASDADAPHADLAALVAGLPKQAPTPVCVYLAPSGAVLLSTAGARPAAVLINDMLEASFKLKSAV